ncbi:hypothetical protein GCM10020001_006440 [Nonomuraea salmonea]
MTTPAERYAAFRQKHGDDGAALRSFRGLYDFALDDFQLDACRALEAGDGVLVAAPTGSGKTVVGEFAVHLALEQGRKCFYTTPPSRRCPTRSTTTWSSATARPRSGC